MSCSDRIPQYSVVLVSHVIHVWRELNRMMHGSDKAVTKAKGGLVSFNQGPILL